MKVVVVGLGPAGSEFLTRECVEYLNGPHPVFLRTTKHPSASAAKAGAKSFDRLYETLDSFETLYSTIVDELVAAAQLSGTVVYAVPGSPSVAETAVATLRNDERIDVDVRPAMSFLELAWNRLGVDPHEAGVRLVDGHRFVAEAAGERGPLLVGQCDSQFVLSDIKLAYEDDTPAHAVVLQRLGFDDEAVFTVDWAELDRVEADIFTSVWIPETTASVGADLVRLDDVTRRLRSECPWDREQTHQSLAKHLIEESYELVEAIEAFDEDNPQSEVDLIEELGDVLIQVFVHSAIGSQEGRFNISDIASGAADKLIERHPHVYGDVSASTSDDVVSNWETNKKASKGRNSIMDGIPKNLPALLHASKVLAKAELSGVDFRPSGHGPGAALMQMVDDLRKQGVDPEGALREAVVEFKADFAEAEKHQGSS
jgi:tetrapyrrole methylase family protein / MazG family protein